MSLYLNTLLCQDRARGTTRGRPAASETETRAITMTSATAFAPATVSNVACGFDVLGFALESPGDWVTARLVHLGRAPSKASRATGGACRATPSKNTAGVAALRAADTPRRTPRRRRSRFAKGFRCPAVSVAARRGAAAAVVAVDAVTRRACVARHADRLRARGRAISAPARAHADNIAPCVVRRFVLVRRPSPPDVDPPAGAGRAHGGRRTSRYRDRDRESPRDAPARPCRWQTRVRQWANLGAFVDGLHRADFSADQPLARRHDRRAAACAPVPGCRPIKRAAVDAGALGCSLSGSGPSLLRSCCEP